MTIHFRWPHALLLLILFVAQLWGMWFSVHHAVYLQDFVQHTNIAALISWLAYFSLGSAFLTTAILAKLLDTLIP